MFNKYLDKYYIFQMSVKEMAEKENKTPSTFNRWLKRNGYLSRQKWFSEINTGIDELDEALADRYRYILKRCKYKRDDRYKQYKGLEYMPVYEYVKFCNDDQDNLRLLWEQYIESNRQPKYSISIDRLDNSKGYVSGNIQFVAHGYNSWKRSVSPIKVTHKDKPDYFLTKEDASRFYGLRRQAIGEIMNGAEYHMKGYEVSESTMEEVLESLNLKSAKEYYENLLEDESKEWDTRKRERENIY